MAFVFGGSGLTGSSRTSRAQLRTVCLNMSGPAGAPKKIRHKGFSHAGMIVEDTAKALEFYVNVLGMSDDTATRPNLAFGGAFVRAGEHQIHLMELPNPDAKDGRPEHGGRDKHVALNVEDIDPLVESLNANGVFYTMSKSGRRALFCRDLDGNALEFIETK
ncbi:protein YwkD [Porphyridium purpureum]|uniref:Protein YwkD n=1 Tax=Porphyridium purpureum TaxID=35688 RepID=A0A5J4YUU9_PORPP|nr:protein YwkD [Porphyridium purpureum]|eukprot:POR4262..scf227_4